MLKIKLSSNNEVIIPLDFKIPEADYDNLKAEKPVKAVLKKVNSFLLSDRSFETSIESDGTVSNKLNKMKYIKQVFVRFVDPFFVSTDDGEDRPVTLKDVINNYEFSGMLAALFTEASKLLTQTNAGKGKEKEDKGAETKKS